MNEMIEKLKKNEKPFGLLSEKERECLKKVKKGNCEFYDDLGKWFDCNKVSGYKFVTNSTYRIKPDYQPEPEYVDLPVVEFDGWLGIFSIGYFPHDFLHLHCIPSMPNFEGFWVKAVGAVSDFTVSPHDIARLIRNGNKVIARFEK